MSQTATETNGAGGQRQDADAVVRSFLERLERLDVDGALELVDDEIVYHNKGLPPARGRDAVARQLRVLTKYASGFEARMHNLATDGSIVLTERTDVIAVGRFRAEFWVCGTFEVRDGRIVLWRDYFDFATLSWSVLRGLARGLVRR